MPLTSVMLLVFGGKMFVNVVDLDIAPQFKRSGISGKGKNIVTKHDPEICGRKNARKVMENVRVNSMLIVNSVLIVMQASLGGYIKCRVAPCLSVSLVCPLVHPVPSIYSVSESRKYFIFTGDIPRTWVTGEANLWFKRQRLRLLGTKIKKI